MKNSIPTTIILGALIGATQLTAAEKWEGSDSFENGLKWNEGTSRGEKGRIIPLNGQAAYSATQPDYDNADFWAWGSRRTIFSIPTGRCWEIQAEAIYPENSPATALSDSGVGLAVTATGLGVVWTRLTATYSSGLNQGTFEAESDFNLAVRPGENGGGEAEKSQILTTGSRRFQLVFRHDALRRQDTFRVQNPVTQEILYQRVDPSTLSLARNCAVGFWISIDRYATWPTGSAYLAMDNWKMEAFNPDPINLNSKSGSSRGAAYSVAVTGLGMTGAKLNGTVALTVGSASATLPITGTIDRNGYFALTAKGTGANKGFSCALLYDVSTGTYRSGKNSLTAPRQKAIKF